MVLFLDMDFCKRLNDAFGHEVAVVEYWWAVMLALCCFRKMW